MNSTKGKAGKALIILVLLVTLCAACGFVSATAPLGNTTEWSVDLAYNNACEIMGYREPLELHYTTVSKVAPSAIVLHSDDYEMSADICDVDLRVSLQTWYEEEHVYAGGAFPTMELEYVYSMLNSQDHTPIAGSGDATFLAFPIVEKEGQIGLSAFENPDCEAEYKNLTQLVYVDATEIPAYAKTTNGTIRLEKTYMLNAGETVQFLDFKLQFRYIVVRDGKHYAKVNMKYAGNYEDNPEVTTVLGQYDDGTADNPQGTTWFNRYMYRYGSSDHANHVTWYARLENETLGGGAEITVGKEISVGDTFYVNGVRYDIPNVVVADTDGDAEADKFESITIRTPLPQGTGTLSFEMNEVVPILPPYNLVSQQLNFGMI